MNRSPDITILIADDHEIVRTGLSNVIDYEDGLEVVALAENGLVALRQTRSHRPDVVILDLAMPGLGGLETLERLSDASPETRVLVLTAFASPDELVRARQAGAAGILMKSATNREIIETVRAIAAGHTVIPPDIARLLEATPSGDSLSDRQRKILESVTRGLTNQDIANQFGITIQGVKKQLYAIYNKLGVSNRAEATAVALRKQLLKI